MPVELPDDILHMVCDAIADERVDDAQKAFDTLYACAVSSKRLAVPALTTLYKFQHYAPVKGGSEDLPSPQQLLVTQKWSILWHSIILSCLGSTLFPYCKYVRVLDFRDLFDLFEEDGFRIQVSRVFFSGQMQRFQKNIQTPSRGRGRGPMFDKNSMIDAVGEELTQHTPMAEEITGPVSASALTRWIPRLPRLRSLDLWDGKALEDERLASLITVHCPNFEDLSIYTWVGNDTDHKLSAFISDLPGDHLHGFKTLSGTGIAAESFLALNNHGQSLRVLKLFLDHDAVPHLGLLKGCVRLETLDISDSSGAVDLEATQNDVFLEMVNWLRDCRDLRQLSFSKFRSAAALSARVLSNSDIKLEQLKLDSYMVKDQTAFHVALTQQPNLTSLSLEGNSDDIFGDDRTVFVNSICHLEQLRYLRLIFRSDDVDLLTDPEIGKLADHLTNLEEFHTSGYGVTDAVLERVSGLGKLRSLSFPAVTAFTLNGLLDFISKLGPGNQELTFLIEMADPDSALTEQEQEIVREALLAKVGGSFGYLLLREPDAEDYSDDSD